jgi:hypothetical protein
MGERGSVENENEKEKMNRCGEKGLRFNITFVPSPPKVKKVAKV